MDWSSCHEAREVRRSLVLPRRQVLKPLRWWEFLNGSPTRMRFVGQRKRRAAGLHQGRDALGRFRIGLAALEIYSLPSNLSAAHDSLHWAMSVSERSR